MVHNGHMHCLIHAVLISAVAALATLDERIPYIKSKPFDLGKYGPYPNRSYISEPDLTSPRLNIQQSDSRCHDGLYIFTSLRGDKVDLKGHSPMIQETNGNLIWMNASYGETFGHGVQHYKGQDYLTFWKGDDSVGGHGEGCIHYAQLQLDSSYREAYNFTAGNSRLGDLHEFGITSQGTALHTQYRYENGSWGGLGLKPQGYIWDSVFQEIDISTNTILFEWHAYDHVNINSSDFPSGSTGRDRFSGYDFFHINSVDKDNLGNYLISSRYYQCLMYISGTSGDILWQLGGKQNSFTDLSDGAATTFAWQHDARWTADYGGITLFDNGARYHLKPSEAYSAGSRGVHIELDPKAMTAQLNYTYLNPRKLVSASQGSMQILPSGNVLLGYGYNAAWTEFSAEGEVLCDVHIGSEKWFNTGAVQTYKVLKHAWVGRPLTKPKAVWREGAVYVSWNGATEVRGWMVKGANSTILDRKLLGNKMAEKTGFETRVPADCHTWRFVKVEAVDGDGKVLGESDIIPIDCKFEAQVRQTESSWTLSLSSKPGRLMFDLIAFVAGCIAIYSLWRWMLRRRTYSVVQQL